MELNLKTIRVLKKTVVDKKPRKIGEIVEVDKNEARLLIALKKAELCEKELKKKGGKDE